MIFVLVVGFTAMSGCLILQAVFLVLAVRFFTAASKRPPTMSWLVGFTQLSVLMMALMLGNIVQILFWALIYRVFGAFDDLETATYFSGVTFTTLGYGDELLKGRYRFLGPLQAANGVMMFGLSTATLLSAVQHVMANRRITLPVGKQAP